MSIWDSVRSTVDKVTGSSANVTLEADSRVVRPGERVNVRIGVKNGLGALKARGLLLEIEAIETINLPRYANVANLAEDILEDVLVAQTKQAGSKQARSRSKPLETHNSTKTFSATISVSPALDLAVGQEKKFQGMFRLPANVQPTYEGKYVAHTFRMRARLDIFGTDPSTPWHTFRVLTAQ